MTSNITRVIFLRQSIHRKIFTRFIFGVPFGAYLGYQVLSHITRPTWLWGLIAILLLYVAIKPKKMPHIHIPIWAFSILGLIAGCLGPLIGAVGPLLAPFLVRDDLSKEELVATKAICQFSIHLMKIPVFLALAFPYKDHAPLIAAMLVAVIIGTRIGTWLLKRIDGKQFTILLKLAMALTAFKLLNKLLS